MPALADRFHVIAPDYPGFGNSDMPHPAKFAYTFDKTSEIIEPFLSKVGFTQFGLYAQDYGGPVGFRIVTRRPDWLEWLIIQNTNAYEVGFTSAWDGLRGTYWKTRSPEAERPLESFLQADTVKLVYTHGHPRAGLRERFRSDLLEGVALSCGFRCGRGTRCSTPVFWICNQLAEGL